MRVNVCAISYIIEKIADARTFTKGVFLPGITLSSYWSIFHAHYICDIIFFSHSFP